MRFGICFSTGVLAISAFCDVGAAAVLHVDSASVATNPDGSNWDSTATGKCYRFLQDALAAASPGDEIRIGPGRHFPDESSANPTGSGDQNAVFIVDPGRIITGGYKGVVGFPTTSDDFNPSLYVTVLSGDLDGDDDPNEPLDHVNRSENSHSVVIVKANAQPQNTRTYPKTCLSSRIVHPKCRNPWNSFVDFSHRMHNRRKC